MKKAATAVLSLLLAAMAYHFLRPLPPDASLREEMIRYFKRNPDALRGLAVIKAPEGKISPDYNRMLVESGDVDHLALVNERRSWGGIRIDGLVSNKYGSRGKFAFYFAQGWNKSFGRATLEKFDVLRLSPVEKKVFDLQTLRQAVAIYFSRSEGSYPRSLSALAPKLMDGIPEGKWVYNPSSGSVDCSTSSSVSGALEAIESSTQESLVKNLNGIRAAVQTYYAETEGRYPATLEELVPRYIKRIPPGDWYYNRENGRVESKDNPLLGR